MFLELPNLLEDSDIEYLIEVSTQDERWQDGRGTAPNAINKHNKQIKLQEQFLETILMSNPKFIRFCYPKYILPAILSKYEHGEYYGMHTDAPFIRNIRNDLACTVFLSDPSSYEGGELVIELGDHDVSFKLPVGYAVIYPSHFMHRVNLVKNGIRLAAITFIESLIKDTLNRNVISTLEKTVDEIIVDNQKIELTHVINHLKREWGQ